ncbi:MAG: RluA family pseudouridine synthase [Lachnospiraceae bacterium]|nr:RluA family pseudouridine synthase [Lachnospiraceae bacterium]
MKEYVIAASDEGSRLDKQLFKIMDKATAGFIYKMLRKKNITLNGRRASGSERLKCDDVIRIYLSDDTFDLMRTEKKEFISSAHGDISGHIIYEDEDILLINKPSGMLSQRSSAKDTSLNELCLKYLMDNDKAGSSNLDVFVPSICNRLDRNTSGIVIFAKTYVCARCIASMLKEHRLKKTYRCHVKGIINEPLSLNGYLTKDHKSNIVKVTDIKTDGSSKIITRYRPVKVYKDHTLLEVDLVTGKSHQIRAHLSSVHHPVLGDNKYGDFDLNRRLKEKYRIDSQMLHAYSLTLPDDMPPELKRLSGMNFQAPMPDIFEKLDRDTV